MRYDFRLDKMIFVSFCAILIIRLLVNGDIRLQLRVSITLLFRYMYGCSEPDQERDLRPLALGYGRGPKSYIFLEPFPNDPYIYIYSE